MAEIWPPPPPPGLRPPSPSALARGSRLALAPLPSQPARAGADPRPGALAGPAARARGCFREQVKMAENLLDGPPNPKRAKLSSPGFSANDSTGEGGPGGGRGPHPQVSAGETLSEAQARAAASRDPAGPAEGKFVATVRRGPERGPALPGRSRPAPELGSPPRAESERYLMGGKVKWSVLVFVGIPRASLCRRASAARRDDSTG